MPLFCEIIEMRSKEQRFHLPTLNKGVKWGGLATRKGIGSCNYQALKTLYTEKSLCNTQEHVPQHAYL